MPLIDKLLSSSIKYLQKKRRLLRSKKKRQEKKRENARKKAVRQRSKVKKKILLKRSVRKKKKTKKKIKKLSKRSQQTKKRKIKTKKPIQKKIRIRKALKGSKVQNKIFEKKDSHERHIGSITHYFSRIEVVVIKLSKAGLSVGNTIHLLGSTTDFTQKVKSLQIESVDVQSAKKGELVGLKVGKKAKEGDKVFLIV